MTDRPPRLSQPVSPERTRRTKLIDEVRQAILSEYRADAMEPPDCVPEGVVLDFNRRADAIMRDGADPGPELPGT